MNDAVNSQDAAGGPVEPRGLLQDAWVIVNPGARQSRRGGVIRQIAIEQEQIGARWHMRISMRPGRCESLAAEAVQSGARLILAAGGDGTLHEIVNAVMRFEPAARPVVGVVPLGSGNDFAKMLGVPEGVSPALAALRGANVAAIDVGRAGPRWFINDMGLGLLAEATKIYHALPGVVRGPTRYLAAALRVAAANPSGSVRVSADGATRLEGPFSLLAVSNGAWTGGLFCVNPQAVVDDGLLDVCLARPISRWEALKNLPRLAQGRHGGHAAVETFRAETVRVESGDQRVYHLDGELYDFPREGLEVGIEPKALRFLVIPTP